MANDEVTFNSQEDMKDWLIKRGLEKQDAQSCASVMWGKINKAGDLISVSENVTSLVLLAGLGRELATRLHEVLANKNILLRKANSIDLTCVFLAGEFLENNNLHSYKDVAESSKDKPDVEKTLDNLFMAYENPGTEDLKSKSEPKPKPKPKPEIFTAIVAPTGTGKTQLAATAARKYAPDDDTGGRKNHVVRYLLCDKDDHDNEQQFYVPHKEMTKLLYECITQFKSEFGEDTKGAAAYLRWFSNDESQKITSPLASLLYRIFYDEDNVDMMSFWFLQETLGDNPMSLLFFLDETPPKDTNDFKDIILFRDVLRAIGICPILMSTHSGAENGVRYGYASSGSDEDPSSWCHLITRLPKFHATNLPNSKYFVDTERPLVATYMSELKSDDNNSIDGFVKRVRNRLQSKKPNAWLDTPIFQLCQLFRTEKDRDSVDSTLHRLVGSHFGYLVNPNAPESNFHILTRKDVLSSLNFQVQMVVPSEEPFLFTALTSWTENSLSPTPAYGDWFPLVDGEKRPLSVRQAFDKNKALFAANVSVTNPSAIKLNGDILEVISLASCCLASMNADNGIGSGVLLPKFLACVYHFMQNADLNLSNIQRTTGSISGMLNGHETTKQVVNWIVPCSSDTDSLFPVKWTKGSIFRGLLNRPPDQECRDGCVYYVENDNALTSLVQMECKNYQNGINKEVFGSVVKKTRPTCEVTLLFASRLRNMFKQKSSWEKFLVDNGQSTQVAEKTAFLRIQSNGNVSWLQFEGCESPLAPKETTQYLFVVIETGPVN